MNLYDILSVKEKCNDDKLIYVKFNNHEYVFRLISSYEYKECKMFAEDTLTFNDAICQLSVVYPENINFAKHEIAGLADYIAPIIIDKSMIFEDTKLTELLETSRKNNMTFIKECKLVIKAAFSEISLQEINNMSYVKLMEMTADAERILQLRGSKNSDGSLFKVEYEIDEEKVKEAKKDLTDKELWSKGIDPMFFNIDKLQLKMPLVDEPFILGPKWNDEELNKKVGKQILKKHSN